MIGRRNAMRLGCAVLLLLAPLEASAQAGPTPVGQSPVGQSPVGQSPVGQSPVGHWRTFDDKTGQERGLVAIEDHSGTLTGRVIGILDPNEAKRVCEACTDARRDQPILGMTIITGLHRDGDGWAGGEILDPATGSVYRCSLRLEDAGARLVVRGYLGLALFGRSQTWLRDTK